MGEHDGHRLRIMEKLDSDSLLDHELLEIALFSAIPRRNTNDLAHRLLSEFGSLNEIFSASFEDLQEVDGVGASIAGHLCVMGKLLPRLYGEMKKPLYPEFFDRDIFLPYVKEEYKNLTREVLDVYLLDGDTHIFKRRRFGAVDYFNAEMYPEELAKLLARFSPGGIVLVHNHPYGKATVSQMDDNMTGWVQFMCSTHNVLFCDHIVYAPNGVYSYYMSGKLQEMSGEYSIKKVLEERKKDVE